VAQPLDLGNISRWQTTEGQSLGRLLQIRSQGACGWATGARRNSTSDRARRPMTMPSQLQRFPAPRRLRAFSALAVAAARELGAAGYAASWTIGSAIPRPRLDRPSPRRPHVSLERRSAEHHDAGLPAGQISAFERDRAGVSLVRLDRGKAHRGCARDAQNRAVLIEHGGSHWLPSPSPPGNRYPRRPGV